VGIFIRWLDKNAINRFKEEIEKNEKIPIECRIIVAELISDRYDKTIEIMKEGPDEYIKYHLNQEGRSAGERLKQLNKKDSDSWFHICKIAEASLAEALYHCLQCEDVYNVLFASNTINEYILSMESIKWLHMEKIERLMGLEYSIYQEKKESNEHSEFMKILGFLTEDATNIADDILNGGNIDLYTEIISCTDESSSRIDNSITYGVLNSTVYYDESSSTAYGFIWIFHGDWEVSELLLISYGLDSNTFAVILSFEYHDDRIIKNPIFGKKEIKDVGGGLWMSLDFISDCALMNRKEIVPKYVEYSKKIKCKWMVVGG